MRLLLAFAFLATAFAGCLGDGDVFASDPDDADCTKEFTDHQWWLASSDLVREAPDVQGSTPGNSFNYAFVTNSADEWLQADYMEDGIRIVGDVTLEVWLERSGGPNAIPDTNNPGDLQGWQIFSQFGSNHGFAGTYANTYTDIVAQPGTMHHITQTFTMPEGGLVLERGDHLRLLLTTLGLDRATTVNHNVWWGGDTPSSITFSATCYVDRDWAEVETLATPINILANDALLTGALPDTEDVTYAIVPFTLLPETERLTISLSEGNDILQTPKDDMDVVVLDAAGNEVWSIGSPYADESGRYWHMNLEALMPAGDYTVRVNSYSGVDYSGSLVIVQEQAVR